ncbi:MAG: VanZ family protein [Chloroherpetonaceae bacterium]|nr:VanZ family protein [Chloroherpetonaceae bacterium]MDW8438394.1 VanZ family protein [Chloroherpetonaceae bacterium]
MSKSFAFNQLPAIVCAVAIFAQSSVPGEKIPPFELFSHDKLIHVGIYFVFAFALLHALKHQNRFPYLAENALLSGMFFATLYAISDETHQLFTPNRASEIWDLNADLLGIALAALLFWKFPTKKL